MRPLPAQALQNAQALVRFHEQRLSHGHSADVTTLRLPDPQGHGGVRRLPERYQLPDGVERPREQLKAINIGKETII